MNKLVPLLATVAASSAVLGPATAAHASVPAAAGQVQAAAARATWRFGASVSNTSDQSRLSGMLARPLTSARVYFPAAPPAHWSDSRTLLTVPANGTVVVSFKSGTPAQVGAFLAGHPAGQQCYASYFHEPEDNFRTPARQAEYKARWAQYAPVIRAAGCVPTQILMAWTADPRSGRDWRDWYAGNSVDLLAWDMYNQSAPTGRYADPAVMFADVLRIRDAIGKPTGIAEVGSVVAPGTTRAARAEWAHQWAVYARSHGVRFADWWDSTTRGMDYRMDPLVAAGWRGY